MHLFTHFASPNAVLGFSWGRVAAKSQHSIGGNKISKQVHFPQNLFFNIQILAQQGAKGGWATLPVGGLSQFSLENHNFTIIRRFQLKRFLRHSGVLGCSRWA